MGENGKAVLDERQKALNKAWHVDNRIENRGNRWWWDIVDKRVDKCIYRSKLIHHQIINYK